MCLLNFSTTLSDVCLEGFYILVVLFDTMREAFDFVLEVLHFEGKFTTQCANLVNLREHSLELVEILEFFFDGHFRHVFLCHNIIWRYLLSVW